MPTFPVDQPVRLTFKSYSDAAQTTLADPTTVSLDVKAPDGTVTTYTWAGGQVAKDSTGVFHYDVTTVAGHYAFHWKSTGTVATSSDGEFDVDPEYQTQFVTVDDFALYLNNPGLDRVRARFILDRAQILCEMIISPLPAGADVVLLDVAERAFANPAPTGTPAYYAEGEGPFSDTTPGSSGGGLWLSQNNKKTLRNLAGKGGAFSIDMTPADALTNLPWWDTNTVITTVSSS